MRLLTVLDLRGIVVKRQAAIFFSTIERVHFGIDILCIMSVLNRNENSSNCSKRMPPESHFHCNWLKITLKA